MIAPRTLVKSNDCQRLETASARRLSNPEKESVHCVVEANWHVTSRLYEGLESEIRLTSGNDATERNYKIIKMFFRKSLAQTKADVEL